MTWSGQVTGQATPVMKDFGELAIVRGFPHSGLLRLAGIRLVSQVDAIKRVLVLYGAQLSEGAVVTVEPGRVRVRSAR